MHFAEKFSRSALQLEIQTPRGISYGSGFWILDKNCLFVATVDHVIPPDGQSMSISGHPLNQAGEKQLLANVNLLTSRSDIKSDKVQDVALVKVADVDVSAGNVFRMHWRSGVSASNIQNLNLSGYSKSDFAPLSDVQLGADALLIGFPISVLPEHHLAGKTPLLNKGVISGVIPSLRTIVVDLNSFGGSSGGPVIQIETDMHEIGPTVTRLVGILKGGIISRMATGEQFYPGYSIVVSSDVIRDLLSSF
jgi:hypothetical protein